IMECFGPRIKKLRTEHGYTSQKVAEEVGVSKGCISFWENGLSEPKASHIVALSKFFGVSCDFLLGRANK
ncbi:MAG: helix-turn-helix domain-containing protein, partial [Christensenellales bacterium]